MYWIYFGLVKYDGVNDPEQLTFKILKKIYFAFKKDDSQGDTIDKLFVNENTYTELAKNKKFSEYIECLLHNNPDADSLKTEKYEEKIELLKRTKEGILNHPKV